jgi:exonuclease SbcC
MRPRNLELLNFACYAGENRIPFDDLEHDLFAIAGPTGSGKSTILDAMTWALYGRTHRLGSQGLNETLMSPGATHLASTLEFTSRNDTYRVTRSVRKLPSGYKPDIKIERLRDDGSWATLPETEKIREANLRVERIVGLDYDSFTRAALLPQGDFAEFLAGDAPKRREVVARLYGGDTAERMRTRAGETARKSKARIDTATARLDGDLKHATAANVEATRQKLRDLQQNAATTQALAKELEQRETALRETAAAHQRLEEARRLLKELIATEPADARVSLARADSAELLRSDLQDLRLATEQREAAASAAATAQRNAQTAADALQTSSKDLAKARAAREAAHANADATATQLATAERLSAVLTRTGGRVSDRTRYEPDSTVDEQSAQQLHESLLRLPALQGLEREAAAAKTRVDEANQRLADVTREFKETTEELERLRKAGMQLRERSEQAAAAHGSANQQHAVELIRNHLHEGDDCPVCEQRVVQAPPRSRAQHRLGELQDEANKANEELREALSSFKGLERHGRRLAADRDRLTTSVKALQLTLKEAERNYGDATRQFPVEAGSDTNTIKQTLEARLGAQHSAMATVVHGIVGDALPEETLRRTQEQRDRADIMFTERTQTHEDARAAATQSAATQDATQANLSAAMARLELAQGAVSGGLAASPFATPNDAMSALLDPDRAQALRNRIANFDANKAQATHAVDDAVADMKGRQFEPDALQKTKHELQAARSDVLSATEAIGRCKTQLEILEELAQQAEALRTDRATHQKKHDTYATLERSLRASAFQAFLLVHAQRELAKQASETIRAITDGRYALTFHDDSFYVRDTWQDTLERNVKTLSGGETFVVSLALALALSDSIAGRHTLGALFLDEGFGSLDAETLSNVAEVLASLTSTGRMVGIISHVSSLTELMPQRLLVSKSESGSRATWDA